MEMKKKLAHIHILQCPKTQTMKVTAVVCFTIFIENKNALYALYISSKKNAAIVELYAFSRKHLLRKCCCFSFFLLLLPLFSVCRYQSRSFCKS